MTVEVQGLIAPGFEVVRKAFVTNFEQHGEVGAACSLYVGEEKVVDIWGGIANVDSDSPWQEDTLQLVFSAAKAVTATCIHMLVERGKLDLDEPVSNYWPEFSVNRKEQITTRMVLSHRAGLAAVDGDFVLEDILAWDPVVKAIAQQAPNWTPGTEHGYHARSFGWILGEILRRIEGISVGQFIQREIATPLDIDVYVGLPEDQYPRCSKVVPPEGGMARLADLLGSNSLTYRVMHGPSELFDYDQLWNRPDVLACEMPSSNAVSDARSLAKFYAALSGQLPGLSLLSEATLTEACKVHSEGPDKVVLVPTRFGLGYALAPYLAAKAGPKSFGHAGAGGSLALADSEAGISFGYVANRMLFDPKGDPRTRSLIEAVYKSI